MQRTEQIHEKANGLDKLEGTEILAILLDSQVEAAKCVLPAIEPIELGARAMADAIINGNKLIYAAAGSSGLQAKVDNLGLTIIAAFAFFAATVGINMVANFIPPAYDLANLMPSKINFKTGGIGRASCRERV